MEADDEALKVRERQEVKVKVQRSLQKTEAQSFQRRFGRRKSCTRPGGVLGQAAAQGVGHG